MTEQVTYSGYMKALIFLLTFFSISANAQQLKVAVLDTGIDMEFSKTLPLCKRNFNAIGNPNEFPYEELLDKHGTNVAGLIDSQIENKDGYCLMIIKIYKERRDENTGETVLIANIQRGIELAIANGAKVINISGGGSGRIPSESEAVKKALKKGIKIIAAAGNDGKLLTRNPTDKNTQIAYYPALADDRVIVVGSTDGTNRLKTSNYGSHVDIWENGKNRTAGGVTLTGTSQATAVVTGKIVNKLLENKRKADELRKTRSGN